MNSEEIITKHGQTPYEVAEEFIAGLKAIDTPNEDMEKLFDYYVQLEDSGTIPHVIMAMVHNRNNNTWDVAQLPLIKNNRMNVSIYLLAWLASQSSEIPDYVTTYLGLLAVKFYRTHDRSEKITLKWAGEQGVRGKVFNFRSVFPWAMACTSQKDTHILLEYPIMDCARYNR